MTFDLPNEHPLARHVQMCRDRGELPLVMRPIREIERTMQVGYCANEANMFRSFPFNARA
jgi:hypothetical protein